MGTFKCQEFAYGSHTVTPTQVKKHFIQMNDYEKQLVTKAIKNINLRRIVISPHLYEKMEKQGVTFGLDVIYDTIRNFNIETDLIEVNYNKDRSTRVVFKSRKTMMVNVNGRLEECKMAFVINLTNGHIVSVWYRNLVNIKKLPDLRYNYDKNLNVAKHLRQYI